MIKFTNTNTVTVKLDDRDIVLTRSELEADPHLYAIVTSFDQVKKDLVQLEYEREVLIHAQASMEAQLQKQALKYAAEKYGVTLPGSNPPAPPEMPPNSEDPEHAV